jgi:hypothetical protein
MPERALGDSGPLRDFPDRVLRLGKGREKVTDGVNFGALVVIAVLGSSVDDQAECVDGSPSAGPIVNVPVSQPDATGA